MLKKLNNLFDKTKSRKIFLSVSLLGWFSDISNMIYLQKFLLPKYLTNESITKMLVLQGFDQSMMDVGTIDQVRFMMESSFGIMLMAFAIAHTLFYILIYKRKKGMMKYIKNYSLTAFILTILTAPTFLNVSFSLFLFLLLTTFAYFYNYRALKYLLNKKRDNSLVKSIV